MLVTLRTSEGLPASGYNNRAKRGVLGGGGGGALSMQPKIPGISVGPSNGTNLFGLVQQEYSEPALKVVHFDRFGHLGR